MIEECVRLLCGPHHFSPLLYPWEFCHLHLSDLGWHHVEAMSEEILSILILISSLINRSWNSIRDILWILRMQLNIICTLTPYITVLLDLLKSCNANVANFTFTLLIPSPDLKATASFTRIQAAWEIHSPYMGSFTSEKMWDRREKLKVFSFQDVIKMTTLSLSLPECKLHFNEQNKYIFWWRWDTLTFATAGRPKQAA